MSFNVPAPKPDPNLQAQEQTAQDQQARAIQSGLSQDSLNIFRQFSQSNALYGANLVAAPMSTASGGFTTPTVNPSTGAPVGTR